MWFVTYLLGNAVGLALGYFLWNIEEPDDEYYDEPNRIGFQVDTGDDDDEDDEDDDETANSL